LARARSTKMKKFKRYAMIGAACGVGGVLVGYKMQKRVGAIEEFVIQPLAEGRSLHCVLAISGWIEDVSFTNFFQLSTESGIP
uniref:Mitoguardin 1 n=1 Tax=Gongylonema pulchrum TaxID=637853 RepID=A0A183EYZ7_9BILA